jgi:hypothetical protein
MAAQDDRSVRTGLLVGTMEKSVSKLRRGDLCSGTTWAAPTELRKENKGDGLFLQRGRSDGAKDRCAIPSHGLTAYSSFRNIPGVCGQYDLTCHSQTAKNRAILR